MTTDDLVRSHYSGEALENDIVAALRATEVDVDHLTVEDLAPIDELHAGGMPATVYLLEQLGLGPRTRLLDIGGGIGGPSRIAAHRYSCPVVAVDLSPDLVRVARVLTEGVGLSARVEHVVAAGDSLNFPDASFDRAMMIHVGMNIPDKPAVFAEIRRVVRPGGLFGLFEQMRMGSGELPYPQPWAEDDRSSFVVSPDGYADALTAAGFVVEHIEDRTPAVTRPAERQRLSPAAVFGEPFERRIANNVAARRAGLLATVLMLARAT